MRRAAVAIGFALLAAPLGTRAFAQDPPTDPHATASRLLDALKTAPNEQDAALIETHIVTLWVDSATPAVRLLLGRANREEKAGDNTDAVEDFGAVLALQPDLADAWRQRAEARIAAGDTTGAIGDLGESVKREPREFLAYRALTQIAASRGNWKAAYAAWSKLVTFDPDTQGGAARLKELRRKALGEET